MNVEHSVIITIFIDAIYRADIHTTFVFNVYARLGNYIGHCKLLF
jgi:hypothetical protein